MGALTGFICLNIDAEQRCLYLSNHLESHYGQQWVIITARKPSVLLSGRYLCMQKQWLACWNLYFFSNLCTRLDSRSANLGWQISFPYSFPTFQLYSCNIIWRTGQLPGAAMGTDGRDAFPYSHACTPKHRHHLLHLRCLTFWKLLFWRAVCWSWASLRTQLEKGDENKEMNEEMETPSTYYFLLSFLFFLSHSQEMKTLFCLPLWEKSHKKRMDLQCSNKGIL